MAIPRAVRALSVSWAVTAATPANMQPASAVAAPRASEPAAGSRNAICTTASSRPTTRHAPIVTASAAASAANRPTMVAPTSSSRPASSSARVCRITAKMPSSPAPTATNSPAFQTISAPSELPYTGPLRARNDGLAWMLCASEARSPAAVNRWW